MTVDLRNLHFPNNQVLHPGVLAANNTSMPISNTGNSRFYYGNNLLELHDVVHCPSISKNLLSINKLCSDNDFSVTFDDSSISIKDRHTHSVVATGRVVNRLYQLDLGNRRQSEANSVVNLELWHARLGHISD